MESVGHGPIRREMRDGGRVGGKRQTHRDSETWREVEMTLKVLESVLTLESLLENQSLIQYDELP